MKLNCYKIFLSAALWFVSSIEAEAESITVDHRSTDLRAIPAEWIIVAKQQLHIAYGHTSHGSQLTSGMEGLIDFANNNGWGPIDLYAWDDGGSDGALDLDDYAMDGDVGYYPAFVNETIEYLDDPAHADVNVIIWSWCGQVGDKYHHGTLYSQYLTPMTELEDSYPDVTFIYMTGHADIWDDEDNKAANNTIRQYCIENSKVLYDFADIEHYDPDGNYYEFVNDSCDYYSPEGELMGNWATEWQDSHTEGVDWYNCSSAHSQPLNANRKAYAAWWLWARLAGWTGADAPTAFQVWQSEHFSVDELDNPALERTLWGAEADPDGDLLSNLKEFALILNPRVADARSFLVKYCGVDSDALHFRYRRSCDVEGVAFSVEASSDLASDWSELPLSEYGIVVTDNGDGSEEVDLSFPTSERISARFYRLKVGADSQSQFIH